MTFARLIRRSADSNPCTGCFKTPSNRVQEKKMNLSFGCNYIKARIYRSQDKSSCNFSTTRYYDLAPSTVTNLLKRIAILHKHPCDSARRISQQILSATGVDITFLLDRLNERTNRYSASKVFHFFYGIPTILKNDPRERFSLKLR